MQRGSPWGALYAFDTLVMARKRNWNSRSVHLAGCAPSKKIIEQKRECLLCGSNVRFRE